MSRNYNGGNPPEFGGGKTKASDMLKEAMFKAKVHGAPKGGGRYGNKPDYKEQMQNRIEEYKAEMMKEAGKGRKIALPGTDPDQEQGMSENAKKALAMMAEKKAQKEAKKKARQAKREAYEAKKKANDQKKLGGSFGATAYVGGKAVDVAELDDNNGGWGSMYSRRDDDDRGW